MLCSRVRNAGLVFLVVLVMAGPLSAQAQDKYGVSVTFTAGQGNRSTAPKTDSAFPDYSAMLALCTDTENLRLPTKEELEKLRQLWPTVPVEQNAVFYFAKGAVAVARDAEPPGSLNSQELYQGDVAAFDVWVKSNQPALEALSKGFAFKTCEFPVFMEVENGEILPASPLLAYLRNLARVTCDAGFLEELKNRPDAAADAYLDAMRLGGRLRERSIQIGNLLGVAMVRMGQWQLDRLVANSQLSDETLNKIIAGCRQAETGRDELHACWNCEAAYANAFIALQSAKAVGLAEDPFYAQAKRWYETVGRILATKTQVELLQRSVVDALYKNELKDFAGQKDAGFASFDDWATRLGRTDLCLRVTQIRAGLALYKKRHNGQLPETLDALCPDILPSVPIDPFSADPATHPAGKGLRYAKDRLGWDVWSVGADNKDNEGAVDLKVYDAATQSVWDGPDYLFTSDLPSNLFTRSGGKLGK